MKTTILHVALVAASLFPPTAAVAVADDSSNLTVEAPLSRDGPRLTVQLVSRKAGSNWHYEMHVTTTDGLDQRFEIRNGQPITAKDIRLTDLTGNGFLDIRVVGGKDHRGKNWFKTWLYDPKATEFRWLDAAAGAGRDTNGPPADTDVLWRRLAVVSIREHLGQPGREAVAASLGKRLDDPKYNMTVEAGADNTINVDQLRDWAALAKSPFPKVDPKAVVVVYLNGPVGGGGRVGVIFNRTDAKELAIVTIPGK